MADSNSASVAITTSKTTDMMLSPDGRYIYVGSAANSLVKLDALTGAVLNTFAVNTTDASGFSLSSDGLYLSFVRTTGSSYNANGQLTSTYSVFRVDTSNGAATHYDFTGFSPNGWASSDRTPRLLADVNGDGRADIVAFGTAGTYVALAGADGGFAQPALVANDFGTAQGWSSDALYHRELVDVNGDGLADIVGFGQAGVLVGANEFVL